MIQNTERQLVININEIGNTAANQINSIVETANSRIEHEVRNLSTGVKNNIDNLGNQAMSIIDESNVNLPDDENNSLGKVYTWRDKMDSRTKIAHPENQQR